MCMKPLLRNLNSNFYLLHFTGIYYCGLNTVPEGHRGISDS